ncbi:hypothetical protein, partial [Echinicola sediminis]
MKNFLIRSLLFLAIFLLLTNLPVLVFNEIADEQDTFDLPKQTQYLFLGNSRPECALNTDYIGGAVNFSKRAEAYFYTHLKAQKLIEENEFNDLKAVFIQFSIKGVSKERDKWVWSTAWLQEFYPKYHHLMSPQDLVYLYGKNFSKLLSIHISQTLFKQARNSIYYGLAK